MKIFVVKKCALVVGLLFGLTTTVLQAAVCTYTIDGSPWAGGNNAKVTIKNTGNTAITSWNVSWKYANSKINNSWGQANIAGANPYTATQPTGWAVSIAPGQSYSFGMTVNTTGSAETPVVTGAICGANNNVVSSKKSSVATSSKRNSSINKSSTKASAANSSLIAVATYFKGFGDPYGGCGISQSKLESQNFVALNVFNTPKVYSPFARPIAPANAKIIGEFNNGLNCGRWVRVTINENCNGLNDGHQFESFCRGGTGWFNDAYSGATLDMIVADSCTDDNSWCRDSPRHLDLAEAGLNKFAINGSTVNDMLPLHFNNRKISWEYIPAPNYSGDIAIYFMRDAQKWWPAIAINHLKNGIHGVEQLVNGSWVAAKMNSDLGQSYILQGGVSSFQIRVRDANNELINSGRVYNFNFPAVCGEKCADALTAVRYSIQ